MLPAADACRQLHAAWQAAQPVLLFLLLLPLLLHLLLLLFLLLLLLLLLLVTSQHRTNEHKLNLCIGQSRSENYSCSSALPCPSLMPRPSLCTALSSACQFVLLIKRISKCKIHSRGVPFDARSTLDLLPLLAGKSRLLRLHLPSLPSPSPA